MKNGRFHLLVLRESVERSTLNGRERAIVCWTKLGFGSNVTKAKLSEAVWSDGVRKAILFEAGWRDVVHKAILFEAGWSDGVHKAILF